MKRGYTNFFLGFVLALVFLWAGIIGGDTLPFGTHYNRAPDFQATARAVFANTDLDKRIELDINGDSLKAKKHGGEFTETLFVNTFESDSDKQNYSVNGYNVVVDTRPADTLAEIEAYCISNDGKETKITYEEYLTLSNVAKLNFDFKIKYTGNPLELNDTLVAEYRAYVDGLSNENKLQTEKLASELTGNKITKQEYDRAIYQMYFTSYYPEITAYENSSKVPLLRNFYYHEYINDGESKYLFVFNDYMAGSFVTKGGITTTFYGFYGKVANGLLVSSNQTGAEANNLVDNFIKQSFNTSTSLSVYVYTMNIIRFVPFVALMPLIVAILVYSIMKLRGVESIKTFGSIFKIIGSYVWFSGVIAAVITLIMAFFVQRGLFNVLSLVIFFIALTIRAVIFSIKEAKIYKQQKAQEEANTQTEA